MLTTNTAVPWGRQGAPSTFPCAAKTSKRGGKHKTCSSTPSTFKLLWGCEVFLCWPPLELSWEGLAMGQYFTKTLLRDFPPKGILDMLHRWGTLPEKSLKPCLTKTWFRQPRDPKQTNPAPAGILNSHSQHHIVLSMWKTLSFLFQSPLRSNNLQIKHQGKDWSEEPVQLREGKLSLRGEKSCPHLRTSTLVWSNHMKIKIHNSHLFPRQQFPQISPQLSSVLLQWRGSSAALSTSFVEGKHLGILYFQANSWKWTLFYWIIFMSAERDPWGPSTRNEADTNTKSIRYGLV